MNSEKINNYVKRAQEPNTSKSRHAKNFEDLAKLSGLDYRLVQERDKDS